MSDDSELYAEIAAQADRADENREKQIDLKALAVALGQRFEHRSLEEIEGKLRDVWRSRGLFWKE